ncbi:NmrA family NAD(P)-binding protein [Rathayibacter soli]|uniref:NmrA family NAD(P)-binding protein n=1 Tax=Rathayibacter soli TaxID=3144168 RepID=UPI0027E586C8|nr:NmrA family NAD(P)-binding protein [Glaciibacter superstes]
MTTIALTGSTGHIGGIVARTLALDAAHRGRLVEVVGRPSLRLVARELSRVPRLDGVELARADYADAAAVRQALAEVDIVFMVSATESADRLAAHRSFIQAAAQAGVRHLVYTSFVGAGNAAGFTLAHDHGLTEQAIRESGMTFTFLRDNFYLDLLPFFADEAGVIRGPAGEGRAAAVARADVADAVVAILNEPAAHENAVYELTGREALTFAELACRVSAATGRSVTFHNETVAEAYASRQATYPDAEQWQLDAWVSTYTAIADGELERVTGDVQALTGHQPRLLEDVL